MSQASVKISVKEGTVEVSGSEEFVKGVVFDPDKLQLAYMRLEAAKAQAEAAADDIKGSLEDAKEQLKLAMKILTDVQQRQQQAVSRANSG